jgi:hypothetical protein
MCVDAPVVSLFSKSHDRVITSKIWNYFSPKWKLETRTTLRVMCFEVWVSACVDEKLLVPLWVLGSSSTQSMKVVRLCPHPSNRTSFCRETRLSSLFTCGARSKRWLIAPGKFHGVILQPEGLVEIIPESIGKQRVWAPLSQRVFTSSSLCGRFRLHLLGSMSNDKMKWP